MKEITSALNSETTDAWRAQYIMALAAEGAGNSRLASENLRHVTELKPNLQEAREALARLASGTGSGNVAAIPYSKLAFKSDAWPLYP